MQTKLRLLLAGILMALAALPVAASEVYSVFWDNRFGTVDDLTGAFTQIATLPIAQGTGIAYDNGTLYAQNLQSDLISIDPVSGAASVIGSLGLQLTSAVFAGGNNGLFEVDYASNLYSINPNDRRGNSGGRHRLFAGQ